MNLVTSIHDFNGYYFWSTDTIFYLDSQLIARLIYICIFVQLKFFEVCVLKIRDLCQNSCNFLQLIINLANLDLCKKTAIFILYGLNRWNYVFFLKLNLENSLSFFCILCEIWHVMYCTAKKI